MPAPPLVLREYCMIVQESALMTPVASPVVNTSSIYVRLTEQNSFTIFPEIQIFRIPFGGGIMTTTDQVADHYTLRGQMKTKLYPAQAAFLLNWAGQQIDTAQTAPWTTTEPTGDLPSCSIYHAVRYSDGTYQLKRYGGCKVAGWQLEASRQEGAGALLTLDIIGCRSFGNAMDGTADPTTTEFPAPATADFPSQPYTFSQTAGQVTIGSARTQYESMALKVTNTFDPRFWETPYLSSLPFMGRESSLELSLLLKATPDDRTAYEAQTAMTASVAFHQGAHSATIAFNAQNRIGGLAYNLPLNEQYRTTVTMTNLYDLTAGSDFTLAFA